MLRRRLLKPSSYDAQQADTALSDGSLSGYGLGVYVNKIGAHRVISHDGASMGFLTQNRVYPDDGMAIVVMVNADFGSAQYEIAQGLEQLLLGPPPAAAIPPAPAQPPPEKPVHDETTGLARRVLEDLTAGRLDTGLFTADGASYFTQERRGDLQATLARLGPPQKLELARHEPWAGYDASIHELTWKDQAMVLIMFRTADGRLEEYYLFAPE